MLRWGHLWISRLPGLMQDRPMRTDNDEELFERLRALAKDLPLRPEIHELLNNLEDPANDTQARDRHTAIVAAGAVDEGLRLAIERRFPTKAAPPTFDLRIKRAKELGIVTSGEAAELDKLRLVRNAFAHSLVPVGFDHPTVVEATTGLWDHPVSDFSGYFAPVFEPRVQFAIVCSEFFRALTEPEAD